MATKEAIAIVLDVGASMHENKGSVLEEAKKCVSTIIQRKIFSESKDEVALVLCGISNSDESSEEDNSGYENISTVQNFQPSSWNLLERVAEIKGTKVSTDLIRVNALFTAISLLQNATGTGRNKITSRRIIFLSNFDGFLSEDYEKVEEICQEMKKHGIDLNVIGPEAFPLEDIKSEPEMEFKAENDITKVLYEVNGESYSFSDVYQALLNYQLRKKSPYPWNANLDIGELTIPITAYIKVTEVKPEPWKKAYAFKPEAKIEHRTTYNMNDESQTEVPTSELISAYRFGSTLVPFSEEDKRNMNYEPGDRGMKILGFTKGDKVPKHLHSGDNTLYVFGRKNDECAGTRLAAFIHALHESKMVGIVRYVYNARSSPKVGILIPKIKENFEHLIFKAVPFLEDLRHFVFSPLDSDPKNIPTEDQLDAVDQLITDMDLAHPIEEDSEEQLKPKNTPNPYMQRVFQCLEFRALHPEKPLPDMEPHIEALVNPSPEILKRAENSMKRVESLFTLKRAEVKQKRAKFDVFSAGNQDESVKKESVSDDTSFEKKFVPETSLMDAVTDKITEVGSVNPVKDFQYLVGNKVLPFDNACDQLTEVVFKYLKDTTHLKKYHSKVLSICKEFRLSSLKENNCTKYNSFLTNLKNILLECDEDLWDKMKSEKISLISSQELPSSAVSVEEAELFLASPSLSESKSASVSDSVEMKMEDDDDEDLLDQL